MDLQHGIIGRHGLEGDVSVPARARKPTDVAELMGESATLLLLLAAYDTDLVAELAALFCQRVDVQTG